MAYFGQRKPAATDLLAVHDRFLSLLIAGDIRAWVKLWDENGVFEFPYTPPGFPRRLEGRAAIADYISGFPDLVRLKSFEVIECYADPTGREGCVEFMCEAEALPTGKPYNQHYISLIKTKNKKVTLYRDFWNPLVVLEAFGLSGELREKLQATRG
jgi:hypothetical protein